MSPLTPHLVSEKVPKSDRIDLHNLIADTWFQARISSRLNLRLSLSGVGLVTSFFGQLFVPGFWGTFTGLLAVFKRLLK